LKPERTNKSLESRIRNGNAKSDDWKLEWNHV